jgi:hypothetical protein
MPFDIRFQDTALSEFKALRTFDQRHIADEIKDKRTHEPTSASRNRKQMASMSPLYALPLRQSTQTQTDGFGEKGGHLLS